MIGLTKMCFGDLAFLNEVRNDFAAEYLHDSRTFTMEETRAWFYATNPYFWIIWSEGNRVGYFRLSNFSPANHNIYIGADIHRNYQGKGFAQEAYKKFIPLLFEVYHLNKISLEVLATNERAVHLYKKLGFVKEGVKRQEVLKDDKYIDSIIMSILKDDIT